MTQSIDRDERLLRSALCIIGLFMLAEAIGGWLATSLTLLADAAHMLLDASALGIQGAPSGISVEEIPNALVASVGGLRDIHRLHVHGR